MLSDIAGDSSGCFYKACGLTYVYNRLIKVVTIIMRNKIVI